MLMIRCFVFKAFVFLFCLVTELYPTLLGRHVSMISYKELTDVVMDAEIDMLETQESRWSNSKA